ncbi:putative calcineurin-like phosphoesterase domain, ApaH type, metallo-dependent phosphatase [Helianthus annuus]|nr:putative calcineurin-like phosphoesterase domain, ApaH type, metallo-dependent phosphatase [Helianthus annuus]
MDMKTLLTYLKLIYPRPHEHSSYAIIAVALSLVFVSPENMRTLTDKLDSYHMMKWWSISAVLLQFFYFFISPFVRKLSYSNFVRWYVTWILAAALYHLPSFQSVGVDTRMNSSLFSTMFVSSLFVLIHLHLLYHGLRYGLKDTGLVSGVAVRRSTISHVIQHCTLLWTFGISWSAPVGSDRDDPLPSKPAIYGESSDEISPIYSLWGLYIFLYITNFFVDILTRWALKQVQLVEESEDNHPKFLDMVPWYSGTSADLFKTLFDLLVSVTVFLGRFDMRMMQATMNDSREGANQEDFLYDHFSEKKEFWFDFMADTGDGGNSSYSIARLLAQRSLHARKNDSLIELPRGDLLLIGGDLAYPNPSTDTYEERFFYPFEEALPPPSWYNKKHLAVNKPELPVGVFDIRQYSGPQSFVIPGNHDGIDGLQTFMRYICQNSWLGGWLMPQKKSYFALQLPKGWWVFGLDVALHNDIDSFQFKFFSELIRNRVKEDDFVIVMTHAPNWILDSYWTDETGKNVSLLISDHLMGKCKLRIAGDLHHYMRHSSRKPATVQHLLVNGGGGAFLHPTHVFSNHIDEDQIIKSIRKSVSGR